MATVYVLDEYNRIRDYKTEDLLWFDDRNTFSNGWGLSWNVKDEDKTWSYNKETLLNLNYEQFRQNNYRYLGLNTIIKNTTISDMEKMRLISAYSNGFYGTLYGRSKYREDGIIYIEPYCVDIGTDMSLLYVWGWPGPDYNIYEPDCYGHTWALTKKELEL